MGMGEGQNGLIDSENLAGGYTHFPVSPYLDDDPKLPLF
jgi:hypothetical protein